MAEWRHGAGFIGWPIESFVRNFTGFGEAQEDLKAVVWCYGGPRPSKLEGVEIKINQSEGTIELHYREKDNERVPASIDSIDGGLHQEFSSSSGVENEGSTESFPENVS